MQPTRRDFLRRFGSSPLLACGTSVPAFLARSASAVGSGPAGRVLVVVQLTGGNDGLNTVVPYRDDNYQKHRLKIRVPTSGLHKIDDSIGLHPALGRFAKALEAGVLAIVQGVGYPNPSRSHFQSLAVWHTARRDQTGDASGWLNRCLAAQRADLGGDAPALHVNITEPPQALAGRDLTVPSLVGSDQVRRRLGLNSGPAAAEQRAALDRVSFAPVAGEDPYLQFIRRSNLITYTSSDRLEEVLRKTTTAAGYPEYGLARRLALIAQLIKAGLSTSIYYTELDGFDTHVNQVGSHPALLREMGDSLSAFLGDLKRVGEAHRVLVLVFSEFGRRLAENASGGTDHGTAAPVYLLGPAVWAGLHGASPDLDDLVDGDPKFTLDFRRIYATVLDQWLACPSDKVLGNQFAHLPLLQGRKE
jgi:uncharacterized protein (DUF1501 family)